MKALQVVEPGKVELIDVPEPSPGDDEVLVKVTGATVCNQHDVKVLYNRYRFQKVDRFPLPPGFPGHEGVGEVVEVGRQVQDIRAGDVVAMTGIGGPGLYAQYVTRKASAVVRVEQRRDDVSDAAPLELFGCVYRAVRRTSIKGKRVAISGLGPAGLAAVQLTRLYEPAELLAMDVSPGRLEFASRFEIDRLIDASDRETMARFIEEGVDVVIDCSGSTASLQTAFLLARQEVTIFGYTDEPFEVNQAMWFQRELTIRNSKTLRIDEDFRPVVRLYDEGKIEPGRLITHRLPLGDYTSAIRLVEGRQAVKVLLDPQEQTS